MDKVKKILDDMIVRYTELNDIKSDIFNAYKLIANAYENKGRLLVAGNGGSAADAEHIVGEMMKGFLLRRPLDDDIKTALNKVSDELGSNLGESLQMAMPAIALTGHDALSSAFANDVDPAMVFAQQVLGYGDGNSVYMGLSTSGNASNVVYGAVIAKALGMKVIGMTGSDGGKLKDYCDVIIRVPSSETFIVQEYHLPVYHTLCAMAEEYFFGN